MPPMSISAPSSPRSRTPANRLQKLAVLRADFLASRQQELEQYIERRAEEGGGEQR